MIFRIETLLICFSFKHFRRLTILFLVTHKFEQVFISRFFKCFYIYEFTFFFPSVYRMN